MTDEREKNLLFLNPKTSRKAGHYRGREGDDPDRGGRTGIGGKLNARIDRNAGLGVLAGGATTLDKRGKPTNQKTKRIFLVWEKKKIRGSDLLVSPKFRDKNGRLGRTQQEFERVSEP